MGCIIICFCLNNQKIFFVFPSRRYHGCWQIHADQVTQLSEVYIWALGPSTVGFCGCRIAVFAAERLELTISVSVQINLTQRCAPWLGLSSDLGQCSRLTLTVSLIQQSLLPIFATKLLVPHFAAPYQQLQLHGNEHWVEQWIQDSISLHWICKKSK